MKIKPRIILLVLYLLSYKLLYAAEIYSLEPYEVFPESVVTIKGSNFSKDTIVVLGDKVFKPFSINDKEIKFNVPADIIPATYRLIVKDKDGSTMPISLLILRREVIFTGYTPDVIDICGGTKEITITGKNLKEIKKVTLNGRDTTFYNQNSSLFLTIPDEVISKAGAFINIYFYGSNEKIVQLVNIPINHKPIIEDIKNISNDLNSAIYKITGKNFVSGLNLFVNNQIITEYTDTNEQQSPVIFQKKQNLSSPLLDRMRFNSCNEIMYIRYPATPEPKRLDIYIENPTGEKSNTVTIFYP